MLGRSVAITVDGHRHQPETTLHRGHRERQRDGAVGGHRNGGPPEHRGNLAGSPHDAASADVRFILVAADAIDRLGPGVIRQQVAEDVAGADAAAAGAEEVGVRIGGAVERHLQQTLVHRPDVGHGGGGRIATIARDLESHRHLGARPGLRGSVHRHRKPLELVAHRHADHAGGAVRQPTVAAGIDRPHHAHGDERAAADGLIQRQLDLPVAAGEADDAVGEDAVGLQRHEGGSAAGKRRSHRQHGGLARPEVLLVERELDPLGAFVGQRGEAGIILGGVELHRRDRIPRPAGDGEAVATGDRRRHGEAAGGRGILEVPLLELLGPLDRPPLQAAANILEHHLPVQSLQSDGDAGSLERLIVAADAHPRMLGGRADRQPAGDGAALGPVGGEVAAETEAEEPLGGVERSIDPAADGAATGLGDRDVAGDPPAGRRRLLGVGARNGHLQTAGLIEHAGDLADAVGLPHMSGAEVHLGMADAAEGPDPGRCGEADRQPRRGRAEHRTGGDVELNRLASEELPLREGRLDLQSHPLELLHQEGRRAERLSAVRRRVVGIERAGRQQPRDMAADLPIGGGLPLGVHEALGRGIDLHRNACHLAAVGPGDAEGHRHRRRETAVTAANDRRQMHEVARAIRPAFGVEHGLERIGMRAAVLVDVVEHQRPSVGLHIVGVGAAGGGDDPGVLTGPDVRKDEPSHAVRVGDGLTEHLVGGRESGHRRSGDRVAAAERAHPRQVAVPLAAGGQAEVAHHHHRRILPPPHGRVADLHAVDAGVDLAAAGEHRPQVEGELRRLVPHAGDLQQRPGHRHRP